jgi:small subunit ribosomal protein S19
MPRSIWKGPFMDYDLFSLLRKEYFQKESEKKRDQKKVTLWSRRSHIIPNLVGYKVSIYNGKTFIPIDISEEMIGHKVGEFAPTRVRVTHKRKTK